MFEAFALFFTLMFFLVGAHFFADYCVQGDAVATGKNKFLDPLKFGVPWYYWMAGHAFTQGLFVAIITQNSLIGMGETVVHFFIDWLKCKKVIGIHMDQFLHICSKVVWTLIFMSYINEV